LLSGGRFRLIAAFLLLSLAKEGSSTYRCSYNSELKVRKEITESKHLYFEKQLR